MAVYHAPVSLGILYFLQKVPIPLYHAYIVHDLRKS